MSEIRYNEKFIQVLEALSSIMLKQGETFRARAYQKAQEFIMSYPNNITSLSDLKGKPNIGPAVLEKLEEFIIKNSGKLITKTLGIVDDVQTYISSAPEAKDVTALAELLKAAASSIEALNKVYTSIEKNKTVKEIKQMDIESKEKINVQDNTAFLLSRKEIMQELIGKSKQDDGKVVDV